MPEGGIWPGQTAAAMDADTGRAAGSPARFRVRTMLPAAVDPELLPPSRRMPSRQFVYATFGTVADSKSLAVYKAALTALDGLDVEALLTTRPHLDPDALGSVPDNVTLAAFVPQAEVPGHAAAVLCHGGSGTLLGALAGGVPLVVAPIFADQPDNAVVVEAIGAGWRPARPTRGE